MSKSFLKTASAVIASTAASMFVGASALASAATKATDLLNVAGGGSSSAAPTRDLPQMVNAGVNVVLSISGILLFLYFFYAGFLWMTAAGDSKKVDSAKSMIKTASIGLLIMLSAWIISSFVLTNLLNATGTV
jgi:hypothetical protein